MTQTSFPSPSASPPPSGPAIALVTGGGRGIGRSAALRLADRGIDAIVTYREDAAAARGVIADLERRGRAGVALPLDVARSDAFPAFADGLRAELARRWSRDSFDVLVHNAGIGGHAPIGDVTEAQFHALFDVHLKGPFFLTQRLLPLLASGGRIIHISTGLTRYTYPGQAVYAAMKGGFEVLTRYLARELGARGITVNTVAPGGIVTDFGGGIMRDPALQAHVVAQTPLARVGEPDDIGRVVAALASGELRWITGQRIEATGGYGL
jgi:NAD(P)-dependent dehydrogenase (short-subunit alcohol dehydrogenase family)